MPCFQDSCVLQRLILLTVCDGIQLCSVLNRIVVNYQKSLYGITVVILVQVWENRSYWEGSSYFIPLTSLSFQDFEESLASRHLLQYLSPQGKQRGQNCSKSFRQLKSFMLQQLKKPQKSRVVRLIFCIREIERVFVLVFKQFFPFYHRINYIRENFLELYFAGIQFDSVQAFVWFFVTVLILWESCICIPECLTYATRLQ